MTTKEMFQVSKFQVVNPLPFSFNKLFRCDDKTAKVKKTKTLIVEGEFDDFFFSRGNLVKRFCRMVPKKNIVINFGDLIFLPEKKYLFVRLIGVDKKDS